MSLLSIFLSGGKIGYYLKIVHYFIHLILGRDIDEKFPTESAPGENQEPSLATPTLRSKLKKSVSKAKGLRR